MHNNHLENLSSNSSTGLAAAFTDISHRAIGALEQTLSQLFSSNISLSDSMTAEGDSVPHRLKMGSARRVDSLIEHKVQKKLSQLSDNMHLTILEMAAGMTYCQKSFHIGAPWLSRSLSLQHEDRIAVTVSDLHSTTGAHKQALVSVSADGEFNIETTRLDFRQLEELGVYSHLQEEPEAAFTPLLHDAAREIWSRTLLEPFPESAGRHFYLRPLFDPVVERRAFGLETKGEVDLLAPGEDFLCDGFDVIFIRHLPPDENRIGGWNFDGLHPLLAPEGILIADVDWRQEPELFRKEPFRR